MPLQKFHNQFLAFLRRIHWKELVAILFILLGVYFFRQERHELRSLSLFIKKADQYWISVGVILTAVYIFLQSGLLLYCFKAVKADLPWPASILLFLKQNFISIFLPGGGVTTFAYLPAMLRKERIERHKIYLAGGLQGFIGIFTVILVGLPVIFYALLTHQAVVSETNIFVGTAALSLLLILLFLTFRRRGKIQNFLMKVFPKAETFLEEILIIELSASKLIVATLFSVLVEFCGIVHLYIAMLASGTDASWEAAFTAYIVSTLFLIFSPLLKGLGAVELSISYILKLYGYNTLQAVEIALLYRLLEFWLPLVAGIIAWAWKGKNLFLRLAPPLLIFLLGTVNIFSVLTPPIASRLHLLKEYIPLESIHASNWLVILLGLVLIVTAAFLIRGLKGAWWLAIAVSALSLIGHLTKALDYEEATLSLFVIIVLYSSRKQYRLRSDPRFINIGTVTGIATLITVLIFGSIGFYWLDEKHFGLDFSLWQSIRYAFTNFLLIQNDLQPITHFGTEFIMSIRVLGIGAWAFFLYTVFRPYLSATFFKSQDYEKAFFWINQYGSSPVDYFKADADKLLFFSNENEGFIAYRVANGFAIVLEEPVCLEEHKLKFLIEFDQFCIKEGLKPAFYRIDEESLYHFSTLKKKKLLIGQEAVMDINSFSLEGKQNKALRNSLNSLQKKGYQTRVHKAPHTRQFINELKAVSDEWLKAYDKIEITFSQGMFNPSLISQQEVIAVHDEANKTVAFLTIIPDYTPDECTYDLIRKTADAPGGCMDALIIKLTEYAKESGSHYLNLGLVPMSGIDQPESTAERLVKYAYEKISRFKHYQGLREFKEKYASQWLNKYLIYENDFDLVQLPAALRKVMEPAS
ncbi:phosphatidylglycerol lysyltransferase domain-containing protein [Solitalea lacus]|uniref:phosphatidylglycerol lysyltransferase domain-containing protein n=1 Tax=Solitalea lacus TaxID=2911172 RepID=UPI001EDA1740|nr:phosphatidylglycerol lysyltransferase domain-containing protein [Solitalea lacus]UKJ08183.1 phosphatidylglycerol lysyltransferase domain-containing protein [Solitalea lacus]